MFLTEEFKEEILKGQGLCKETTEKRNKIFQHFTKFIKSQKGVDGEFDLKTAVMEDKSVTRDEVYQFYKEYDNRHHLYFLTHSFYSYILSYRVLKDVKREDKRGTHNEEEAEQENDKQELPMFKTIEVVKSHLKMSCISDLKLDFTEKVEFPGESAFWKDYLTHLKKNSKMILIVE